MNPLVVEHAVQQLTHRGVRPSARLPFKSGKGPRSNFGAGGVRTTNSVSGYLARVLNQSRGFRA